MHASGSEAASTSSFANSCRETEDSVACEVDSKLPGPAPATSSSAPGPQTAASSVAGCEDVKPNAASTGEVDAPETSDCAVISRIQTLMQEGHGAMSKCLYETAVNKFSEAAESIAQIYGDFSPLCADAVYHYGLALLQRAVETSNVLGDAPEVRCATGKPEKDLLSVQPGPSASASSATTPAKQQCALRGKVFHFAEDEDEDEDSEETQSEGEGEDADADADAEAGGNADGDGDDDLEVAYETLDFARVLYERMMTGELEVAPQLLGKPFPPPPKTDAEKVRLNIADEGASDEQKKAVFPPEPIVVGAVRARLAQVLNALGDANLEGENFTLAGEDYDAAISHRNASLLLGVDAVQPGSVDQNRAPAGLKDPETDRMLAELNYKLGLSFECRGPAFLEKACEYIKQAQVITETRRMRIHEILNARDSIKDIPAEQSFTTERNELASLYLDLELKRKDLLLEIRERDEKQRRAEINVASSSSSSSINMHGAPGSSTLLPTEHISDLSSLVRKRPISETPPQKESSSEVVNAGRKRPSADPIESENKGTSPLRRSLRVKNARSSSPTADAKN